MDKDTKKYLYIGIWLVLGGMVGFLLSEVVELYLTVNNETFENKFEWIAVAVIIGVGFAAFLGPIAWRKIYVEGVRGKKYVDSK